MNAYKLCRPPTRSGSSVLTVYRAVPNQIGLKPPNQPTYFSPPGQLKRLMEASGLGVDPPDDPAEMAAGALQCLAAGKPNVEKTWTELAFEAVRRRVAPGAPSRLTCVFTFADPFEALAFGERTAGAYMVCRATVPEGTTWWMADMDLFEIQYFPPNEEDVIQAYRNAESAAQNYWHGDQELHMAEILVGGSIVLQPNRISLMYLLQDLGMLSDRPPRG